MIFDRGKAWEGDFKYIKKMFLYTLGGEMNYFNEYAAELNSYSKSINLQYVHKIKKKKQHRMNIHKIYEKYSMHGFARHA